jgi:hypothetical protein
MNSLVLCSSLFEQFRVVVLCYSGVDYALADAPSNYSEHDC